MTASTTAALLLLGMALSATMQAADAPHAGQAMHDDNCLRCHGSDAYTRMDRKVTDRAALVKQVYNCNIALNMNWFDEDVADVADYLNQTYYKF